MGFSGSMPMRCAWWPGDGGDGAAVVVAAAAPHVGTARKYLAPSSSSARTSGRSSEAARLHQGSSARDSLRGSLEENPWS